MATKIRLQRQGRKARAIIKRLLGELGSLKIDQNINKQKQENSRSRRQLEDDDDDDELPYSVSKFKQLFENRISDYESLCCRPAIMCEYTHALGN